MLLLANKSMNIVIPYKCKNTYKFVVNRCIWRSGNNDVSKIQARFVIIETNCKIFIAILNKALYL